MLGNKVAGAPGKSMTRDTASARVLGAGELLCERVAAGNPLRLAAAVTLAVTVTVALLEGEAPRLSVADAEPLNDGETETLIDALTVAVTVALLEGEAPELSVADAEPLEVGKAETLGVELPVAVTVALCEGDAPRLSVADRELLDDGETETLNEVLAVAVGVCVEVLVPERENPNTLVRAPGSVADGEPEAEVDGVALALSLRSHSGEPPSVDAYADADADADADALADALTDELPIESKLSPVSSRPK